MNTLFPDAPAWFQTILNLSLQAALLAALVWLICKTLGHWIPPRFRALLWFIVIARVLIPFAPASPLSLQNIFARRIAPAVPPPARVVKIETNLFAEPLIHFEDQPVPTSVAQLEPTAFPLAQTLAAIWISGSVLAFASIAARCWIIRRRLRSETPLCPLLNESESPDRDEIRAILDECRATLGLRYPIRLVVSKAVAAPALTGLYPATLIVPHAFQTGRFTENQIRQILLHELAHVQQGHLWLHWMTLAARALHWFNPILHLAAARFRHECELAADAAALQNATQTERQSYGETILLALSQTTAAPTAIALGLAEQTAGLKQRLRALTQPRRTFAPLGLAVLTLLAATGLTSADIRLEKPSQRVWIPVVAERNHVDWPISDAKPLGNSYSEENSTYVGKNQMFASFKQIAQAPVSTNTANTNDLFTRTYRLEASKLLSDLERAGINPTNSVPKSSPRMDWPAQGSILEEFAIDGSDAARRNITNKLQRAIRQYLQDSGVKFERAATNRAAHQKQPALFYNDRTGVLFLRLTESDLDKVDHALQKLNAQPPLVFFAVQIFEMPDETAANYLRDIPVRTFHSTNEYLVATSGKTNAPVLPGSKLLVNEYKHPIVAAHLPTLSREAVLPRTAASDLIKKLRAADTAAGVTNIAMPEITTVVGRQARLSIEDSKTIVVQLTGQGEPTTAQIPFGPTIDFTPRRATEDLLEYDESVMLTEFLGYDPDSGDKTIPRFRVREIKAQVKLPYDTTHLLILPQQDDKKIPVLDTVPIMNRLFRMDATNTNRRVLIFISPDIIDATGNKVKMKP